MALVSRSANPALNKKTFQNLAPSKTIGETMTIGGTVNRTFILLVLLVLTAGWTWSIAISRPPEESSAAVLPYMLVGLLGGLGVGILTVFKKQWAPFTAPIYALLEGLAIGGISAIFENRFPGIVMQAVGLTFAVLLALLLAYRSGLIKVTENFKLGVVAATGGIMLVYLASFVLGFFGVQMSFIHSSGPIGIIFSLVVVAVASLNLVLDFDFIESGAEHGAPKYMEWYGAFGLIVTLIWLYLELLRLLAKLRSR